MRSENIEIGLLREHVKSLGACKKADRMIDWISIANLMKSPQGIEFMKKYDYPTVETCRLYADKVKRHDIFIDAGFIEKDSKLKDAIFIGNTDAVVDCNGADITHTYVVMYGASLVVKASDYAVVRVYDIGGEVIIDNDGTAKILR